MSTLDQRLAALPTHQQVVFRGFLEYLEWKAQIPSYGNEQTAQREALGARLLAVREALKQSQEAAARVAGLTLVTYERYEQGHVGRWPTLKVTAYATTWNVNVAWLLEGSGTMFRDDTPPQIEPSPPPQPVEAPSRRRGPRGPYDCRADVTPAANVVSLFPRVRS